MPIIWNIYTDARNWGETDLNKNEVNEETLLIHDDKNEHIWVVGAIDTETKDLRINVKKIRNSANLKTFVTNHILQGTTTTWWMMETLYIFDDDDSGQHSTNTIFMLMEILGKNSKYIPYWINMEFPLKRN